MVSVLGLRPIQHQLVTNYGLGYIISSLIWLQLSNVGGFSSSAFKLLCRISIKNCLYLVRFWVLVFCGSRIKI